MKLADITAAAIKSNPNLEVEVETEDGPVEVVFRNVLLISEDERRKFKNLETEHEKILRAKGSDTVPRRLANVAKHMLAQVVENAEHIELLEQAFSGQEEHLRDARWVALAKAYNEETEAGEA